MAEVAPSYGTYASGIGSTIQVLGQLYAAIQAGKMGKYSEAVAQHNAQAQAYQLQTTAAQHDRLAAIAEQDLLLSREAAAFREARMREEIGRVEGAAVARIGASGLELSGSPLYVLEETARQGEMAVLVSNYTAQLEQRAIREERTQQLYSAELARFGASERLRVGGQQADMARYDAGNTRSAGLLGATGSAIQGVSQWNYGVERDRARSAGTTTGYYH